jgi:hypothetical protein
MTTQTSADPTKAGRLAQEIVAILVEEDSLTRQRALQAAMALLGEVVASNAAPRGTDEDNGSIDYGDLASFFDRGEDLKPADYAQLCAAYHFSQYGTAAFSLVELRSIAREAGVIIPDRLDMTLNQASRGGKRLFQSAGRGSFRPTAVVGVTWGERWGVKPGKKTKAALSAKHYGADDAED